MEENTKGYERERTLKSSRYFNEAYFDKYQLFSLSEQIHLLYKYTKVISQPSILEVGKGNGFVSDFFKKAGYACQTFDINKNLEPDIVGNILELNQLIEIRPNIILCSEVLEHIPFDMFEKSLEQLSATTQEYVIITLPEFKKFFGVNMQIRFPRLKVFSLPLFIKIKGNKALGSGHFWELDYDEKSKKDNIEQIIEKYFSIVDKGIFHTAPNHNYYVLKKRIE